jgi:Putative transposase/Transposase zinc-binding domain
VTRPPFEVADIIRQYGTRFIEAHRTWLTAQHLRVLRAIAHCRTAALGGHLDQCAACGHRAISFNSCRNRHCPKCLTHARDQWLAERERELLPVGYAHVVFTLPHALAGLALQNKRVVYDLLFHTSAATLLDVARTPKHLGAALGFLSVLHTWGQTLLHHPHVHCVVPAGGLSRDGTQWVHARPAFFLPVKVLSRVFRGKFVAGLRAAFRAGRLSMPRDLQHLNHEPAFAAWLRTLFRHEWVVYAKPPFGGPSHVLHYLARYTHRVAISNHRLVAVTDDQVTFRWKDYRHGSQVRLMTLSAEEFLRRFCLHVLPKGFVRIRFYGFLAPRCRTEALPRCRQALGTTPLPATAASADDSSTRICLPPCPACGGVMVAVERLSARHIAMQFFVEGLVLDSS